MSDLPCSAAARERGDRWVGTAPPARRWFLVTQPGDWGPTAWQGLHAGPQTKVRLEELLDAAGARLMLVRRPGKRGADEPPAWGIVDTAAPIQVRWGERRGDQDLLAAAATLLDPPSSLPTGEWSAPTSGPGVLLVCTHGRKDRCCAVRGRPVAAAAAEQWPDSTWEGTHTGGDRFAANLVVLPDGACYGGLDPSDVAHVVGAHLAGRVDPAHLRGPTGLKPQAQAAVVAAHQRWGPLTWSDVKVLHLETEVLPRTVAGWTVDLHVVGLGAVRADGHTEKTPPHLLTCQASSPATMDLPIVDHLEVLGR